MKRCFFCSALSCVTKTQPCGLSSAKGFQMPKEASSGYLLPTGGSEMIHLDVRCLNGEGCMLSLSGSTLGSEVRRMVLEQLPSKRGSKLMLHHHAVPLILNQTLQEQGIAGPASVSCTYLPTDVGAAWSYVQGFPVFEEKFVLEGLTQISGEISIEYLYRLPQSLQSLTFGDEFNQSLDLVTLPSSLHSLTFGNIFNQNLERMTFPSSLEKPDLWHEFQQEFGPSDFAKRPAKLDFGLWVRSKLGPSDTSKQSEKVDLRWWIQPKLGPSDTSKRPAKLDFWLWIQPKLGPSGFAK